MTKQFLQQCIKIFSYSHFTFFPLLYATKIVCLVHFYPKLIFVFSNWWFRSIHPLSVPLIHKSGGQIASLISDGVGE